MSIVEENRCPYIRRKSCDDESYDFCEITERPSGRIKPCLLIHDDTCEMFEYMKKEWAEETGETLEDIQLIEKEDELRELKRGK